MLHRAILALALVACATTAGAQMQPIKIQQVSPAVAQAAEVDQAALEKARLERENKKLREENAALRKQVDDFTALGGSNVHAYCPAGQPTVSRNTSGAESNCGQGGYTCEPVSGLCRTSCSTSDECATGYSCAGQRCRTQAEIQAENEG